MQRHTHSYYELERQLLRAGFSPQWGRGSHRKWKHRASGGFAVLPANHLGHDAPLYLSRRVERLVRDAVRYTTTEGRHRRGEAP